MYARIGHKLSIYGYYRYDDQEYRYIAIYIYDP